MNYSKLNDSVIQSTSERFQSLAKLVKLEALNPGRHYYYDENDNKTGEAYIQSLWYCMFMPSFDHHVALVSVNFTERTIDDQEPGACHVMIAASFASGLTTATMHEVVESSHARDEPLFNILNRLPWGSTRAGISLDGIGYVLRVEDANMTAALRFSNPQPAELKELQTYLHQRLQVFKNKYFCFLVDKYI